MTTADDRDVSSAAPNRYEIVPGVDPSNDWRAPYSFWTRNRLMACATALEEWAAVTWTVHEDGPPDFVLEALNV